MKRIAMRLSLLSLLILSSCENPKCNCDDELKEVEEPQNIISVQTADKLYKDYGTKRADLIERLENVTENGDTIPKEDKRYKKATRAIAMPYKQLKEYLKYIEQQADSAGVEIIDMRFYFGKYEDSLSNKKNKGRETIFLNPTAEFTLADGKKDTVSYAIIKGKNGKKRAVMVGSILKGEGYEEVKETNSMAGNHGTLFPLLRMMRTIFSGRAVQSNSQYLSRHSSRE